MGNVFGTGHPVVGSSMTKGTASPLNMVFFERSAIRIPTKMPKKYNPTMMSPPCPGKNTVVKNHKWEAWRNNS